MDNSGSSIYVSSELSIQDIRFAPATSGSLSAKPFDFVFLSIVDTSKVPLNVIAGPSHDVWTNNEATEAWFAGQLGSHLEPLEQSRVGVLVEVQTQLSELEKVVSITEVLFYAVSTRNHNGTGDNEPTFSLKAIPLCSEATSYLPSPPSLPVNTNDTEVDACMLPSLEDLRAETVAKEKKRKQVADVFDEAAERRRKAQKKGGERVAAAAASRDESINILTGHKKPKAPSKTQRQSTNHSTTPAVAEHSVPRTHSRTGSLSGYAHDQPRRMLSRSPSMSSEIRPPSRIGLIESANKRSSLSRVSSLHETSSVEDRNKQAISRLVMAGMRLYGLQQRKKTNHSRRTSEINLQTPSNTLDSTVQSDAIKDEEYKLIYHQTYKGTVFAFRRAIATESLYSNPACLQDTVDKFLAIFCNDPLIPA